MATAAGGIADTGKGEEGRGNGEGGRAREGRGVRIGWYSSTSNPIEIYGHLIHPLEFNETPVDCILPILWSLFTIRTPPPVTETVDDEEAL